MFNPCVSLLLLLLSSSLLAFGTDTLNATLNARTMIIHHHLYQKPLTCLPQYLRRQRANEGIMIAGARSLLDRIKFSRIFSKNNALAPHEYHLPDAVPAVIRMQLPAYFRIPGGVLAIYVPNRKYRSDDELPIDWFKLRNAVERIIETCGRQGPHPEGHVQFEMSGLQQSKFRVLLVGQERLVDDRLPRELVEFKPKSPTYGWKRSETGFQSSPYDLAAEPDMVRPRCSSRFATFNTAEQRSNLLSAFSKMPRSKIFSSDPKIPISINERGYDISSIGSMKPERARWLAKRIIVQCICNPHISKTHLTQESGAFMGGDIKVDNDHLHIHLDPFHEEQS